MFLAQAGFTKMTKVHDFGIFNDSSRLEVEGNRISLNAIVQ
jgi:hypothetical protein